MEDQVPSIKDQAPSMEDLAPRMKDQVSSMEDQAMKTNLEDQEQTSSTINDGGYEITYKDFLPTNDGHVKQHYESFRTLMNHANKWLKHNRQWKVKTCETLDLNFNINNEIETSKMVYVKAASIHYIKALRIWLQKLPPGEKSEQEIGYVNLIPKTTYPASLTGRAEFERLGEVVKRYNDASQSKPIPGRIITIETQAYKIRGNGVIDPEFTTWTEYDSGHYQFGFIVRVYFEVGEPMMEKFGFQDFIPTTTRDCCFPNFREYQDFSEMEYKASRWCLRQTNLTVCHNQFLMIKIPEGSTNPDSTKMSYTRHGMVYRVVRFNPTMYAYSRRLTLFLRILRVAYIRLKPDVKVPFARFTCKSFIPVFLKTGVCIEGTQPEFETMKETVQRASNWIKENAPNVLSIETSDERLYARGANYSSGQSYYCFPSHNDRYYFFIIRVYVDGEFSEESEENSALEPAYKCCCSIQ